MSLLKVYNDDFFKKPFELFEEFDNLLNAAPTRDMKIDIYEDEKSLNIEAELPGVTKKDIKINLEDNVLSIRCDKKEEKEEKGKNYFRRERVFGTFERSFKLPENVDVEKIDANFENGILKLNIPKKEKQNNSKEIVIK
ncbi:heat-shock protein Hsp20 [Tepiditoga spiralis]|uniref:Heat-shock protein Hsp20 n=1 Tax=Tepiditoga spiralis TaxID=2108365 RepID=A0A7G1G1Z5_9BACT|nr:Hsp20/alpha crystallin family protein [Tepiditoga spiralis]BBE30198.1 heat-shock protein Hsp20 [Tepiditoga spiralis]